MIVFGAHAFEVDTYSWLPLTKQKHGAGASRWRSLEAGSKKFCSNT